MPSSFKPPQFDDDVPPMFRRAFDFNEPPADTWHRYQSGDAAAFDELVEHYAPMVAIVVAKAKRRNPELFNEAFADLLSDGAIGLMRAIRNWETIGTYWAKNAQGEIRRAMRREVIMRRFGISHRQAMYKGIIACERSRFVQEHGRMPERHELAARLTGHIANPIMAIDRPGMCPVSNTEDAKLTRCEMRQVQTREDAPDQRAIDRETIRLACKGLSDADKRIFKMLLKGASPTDIATATGLKRDTVLRRLNGVLWEARQRADLAAYVGTEPIERPATYRVGVRAKQWRGGANLPPHVVAMQLQSLPVKKLNRVRRTDDQIIALLRAGYSGRAIVDGTRGQTKFVKARVSALQHELLAELAQPAAVSA